MPHALHMPSHIYTRLGLWRDSIASNLAAREAAKQHGDVGEQLHAMDYLTYAYLQRGRWAEAEQVVAELGGMKAFSSKDFKIGYAATAMPVRLVMERHKWSDAAKLVAWPGSTPQVAAIVFWARAVADARGGHPQKGDGNIASIESLSCAAAGRRGQLLGKASGGSRQGGESLAVGRGGTPAGRGAAASRGGRRGRLP